LALIGVYTRRSSGFSWPHRRLTAEGAADLTDLYREGFPASIAVLDLDLDCDIRKGGVGGQAPDQGLQGGALQQVTLRDHGLDVPGATVGPVGGGLALG